MTAHLLLTVAEQKNPWEQGRIITGLTRIMPSTNVDKSELINYEKLKAAKYIIHMCVRLHVCATCIFLKKTGKSSVFILIKS